MASPFEHLTDEELMKRYQNDEHQAFEVLYSRHKDRVYSFLAKRMNDKDLRDEVFQGVFLKFHKSRHLYDEKYPVLQWLYVISRSELYDAFRKSKYQHVEFQDYHAEFIDEPSISSEINIHSEKSLSDNERKALELRYFSDKDFNEISELLNTSGANARKLISRALQKLRTKYKGSSS